MLWFLVGFGSFLILAGLLAETSRWAWQPAAAVGVGVGFVALAVWGRVRRW